MILAEIGVGAAVAWGLVRVAGWALVAVAAATRWEPAMMGRPATATVGGLPMSLLALPSPLPWAGMVLGNGLLIASLPDVGTIAAAVSFLGLAMIALYTQGVRQITQAKVDAAKLWEDAQKGSLAAQLAALQEDLGKARESLHAIRDEANGKELKLQEEIVRLTSELHATRHELQSMRSEYGRLLEIIKGADRRGRENSDRLDRVEGQSGDDLPGKGGHHA